MYVPQLNSLQKETSVICGLERGVAEDVAEDVADLDSSCAQTEGFSAGYELHDLLLRTSSPEDTPMIF